MSSSELKLAGPYEEQALGAPQLLRGAHSLLANTAATSALGFGFWVLAARLFAPSTLGRDTVLITLMVELSTLCQLNLGNGILRFLPDLGARRARALTIAYLLSIAAALLAGGAFVLLAPGLSSALSPLREDPLLACAFVFALAAWGVFTLQDAALTATRNAPWVPIENTIFGVLKLAALPACLWLGATDGIFLAWVIPAALLTLPVNALIFARALPGHRGPAARSSLQAMGRRSAARFLGADYLASVFTQATLAALPLIVLATLGARQSGYFAIPFAIALAFDTFAQGACGALLVESTLAPQRTAALARMFARRVLVPLVLLALGIALAAPLLLALFGAAYADHATLVLVLLCLACAARLPAALFAALSRSEGRSARLALIELSLLVSSLAGAAALAPKYGIDGVAAAWAAANVALALALSAVMLGRLAR